MGTKITVSLFREAVSTFVYDSFIAYHIYRFSAKRVIHPTTCALFRLLLKTLLVLEYQQSDLEDPPTN